MKINRFFRAVLFLWIGGGLWPSIQAQKIDSLKKIWFDDTKQDSARRLACAYIFTSYKRLDLDSALSYAQDFVAFSRERGWDSSVGIGLGEMGDIYQKKGNLPKAIESMEEGIRIRQALGENDKLGGPYINLGLAYQRNGRNVEAIQAFNSGIQLSRTFGPKQYLGNGLTNLGILYVEQENYEQATKYYTEALDVYQEIGYQPGIAGIYTNLAVIQQAQENADAAIDLFQKGLQLHQNLRDSLNIGLDYFNIGTVYQDLLADPIGSKKYFTLALDISRRTQHSAIIVRSLLGLSQSLHTEKEFNLAIQRAKASMDLALSAGLVPSAMLSAQFLSQLYEETGQTNLAFSAYKQYITLRDSINNEASKEEQIRQEYRFDYEQQAFSDSLSYVQNQATINLAHQQELSQRNYILFGSLGLGMVIFLFFRYRQQVRIREREFELMQERERKRQLAELDSVKSRFFENISHEFRTPLTLILGQSDQLQSIVDNPALDNKFEMLNRNGRRLLGLINQMLDLSKLASDKLRIQPVPLNLVPFLKNMLFSFETLADHKGIELIYQGEQEEIISLVDPEKLERVFFNLMSNAIKFTPEGGCIQLKTEKKQDFLAIGIKDSGVGISREQMDLIFDRFYQADSQDMSTSPGTGIGLALAKELVELHEGNIGVSSELGKGSIFWVELPIASSFNQETSSSYSLTLEPTESVAPVLASTQERTPQHTERILIVEDHPDVRSYLQEAISGFGYQVLEAKDGQEGLLAAQSHQPDMIISDVMMPRMNGFELARAIRADARSSHIPFILLTAKASDDSRITGLETGVDAYLTKPFKAKELQVRINNLFEQRKRLQQTFSTSMVIRPEEVSVVPMDQQFLQSITEAIEANISNPQFGVEALSEAANMSITHLNRKLRALIGQSSGKLIRSMRLQRAADLLSQKAGTISDISYELGFSDPTHFARAFKKQFGMSPSAYVVEKRGV